MSKLVKLSGQLTRGGGPVWPKYLWYAMRHNERCFERFARKARQSLRGNYPQTAASHGLIAVSYVKSANLDRRLLGL